MMAAAEFYQPPYSPALWEKQQPQQHPYMFAYGVYCKYVWRVRWYNTVRRVMRADGTFQIAYVHKHAFTIGLIIINGAIVL
jgi:hypothetical protein